MGKQVLHIQLRKLVYTYSFKKESLYPGGNIKNNVFKLSVMNLNV